MRAIYEWVKRHPQRSMGLLQIALGSLATGLPTLDLRPKTLSIALVICGMITAMLGYLRSKQDATPESVARDHDGIDGQETP